MLRKSGNEGYAKKIAPLSRLRNTAAKLLFSRDRGASDSLPAVSWSTAHKRAPGDI
jgi:hypothetical protein